MFNAAILTIYYIALYKKLSRKNVDKVNAVESVTHPDNQNF